MSELIKITRGRWRDPAAVAALTDRCAVVLSALPAGTVISGTTAARLHGLWLPEARPDEPIEVVLRAGPTPPRERSGSTRPEVRGRRRHIEPSEITIIDGLPALSEARTWLDLAETLPLADLVAAGDSVLRGTTTVDELFAAVISAAGRRGVRRARHVLPLLDARSRSRPESHVRYALVSNGLPKPEVNQAIYNEHGEWLGEPDLHYKRAKVAIEYNGRHHADVPRMQKDIDRAFDISIDEWLTVVCGPKQAFRRQDQLVALVTYYLDQRDPTWRTREREWRLLGSSGDV